MSKLNQRFVDYQDWSRYSKNLEHYLNFKRVIPFYSFYQQFQNDHKCDKNESKIDYDDICSESEVLNVASTVARFTHPLDLVKDLHHSSLSLTPFSENLNFESKLINTIFESARSGNLPLLVSN